MLSTTFIRLPLGRVREAEVSGRMLLTIEVLLQALMCGRGGTSCDHFDIV
jgi:hypothetical protein